MQGADAPVVHFDLVNFKQGASVAIFLSPR